MMFEFNMAELLRHRWGASALISFPPALFLTDYRILKNYAKTLTGAGV
ncbi:YlcG family protein [Escherichia coli]|nr:YlcG family protein [Escherichia coli]